MSLRLNFLKATGLLFGACIFFQAFAQTRAKAFVTAQPQRPLKDTSGHYALYGAGLGISTTLYAKGDVEQKHFQALALQADLSFNRVDYTPAKVSLSNVAVQLGVSYLLHYRKNTWIVNASPFISAPASQLAPDRLNVLGLALYTRRVSTKWGYTLGAVYFGASKTNIGLPVLGCQYHFNARHHLECVLPFRFAYTYRPGMKHESVLALGFNGFVTRIDQPQQDQVALRSRQFMMSYMFRKSVSNTLKWYAKAGITGGRNVSMINLPTGDTNREIRPGIYLQAGLICTFNRKEKKQIPLDLNIFNLDELSTSGL